MKMGFKPTPAVFLLPIPRRFLCCSSLLVRRLFYTLLLFCHNYFSFDWCLEKNALHDCSIFWVSSRICALFKKWILFFSKFIEVWPQWVACEANEPRRGSFAWHAPHCGHTSINVGKNQVHYLFLHYFSHVPWRELQITCCIKGRRIIFG